MVHSKTSRSRTKSSGQKALEGVFCASRTQRFPDSQQVEFATTREHDLEIVLVQYGFRYNSDGLLVPAITETSSHACIDDLDGVLPGIAGPKKCKNAFLQFRSDSSIKARYLNHEKGIKQSRIVQLMAMEWNNLSAAQKLPYQAKAERARRAHKRMLQRTAEVGAAQMCEVQRKHCSNLRTQDSQPWARSVLNSPNASEVVKCSSTAGPVLNGRKVRSDVDTENQPSLEFPMAESVFDPIGQWHYGLTSSQSLVYHDTLLQFSYQMMELPDCLSSNLPETYWSNEPSYQIAQGPWIQGIDDFQC